MPEMSPSQMTHQSTSDREEQVTDVMGAVDPEILSSSEKDATDDNRDGALLRLTKTLSRAGSRKRENADPSYEVKWDGVDDEENVRDFSNFRKWLITVWLTLATFQITSLSSAWGLASEPLRQDIGMSQEVSVLGISLYVLALAIGPLLFAPLSEFYGRRPVYLFAYIGYFAFQFPTAFGHNTPTVIIPRFIAAFFASSFMANVSGTISDLFDKDHITYPVAVFTAGPFIAPGAGPLIAGFIVEHVSWRWVFYVMIIWTFCMALGVVFLCPETFGPVLLAKKAKRLRKTTGNQNLYAPFEVMDKSLIHTIKTNCSRPFMLLSLDPILLLLCVYSGFVLAVVYLFFVVFPIVFEEVYGFNYQDVGMAFIGLIIGMASMMPLLPVIVQQRDKAIQKNGGVAEPEMRLPGMCAGSLLMPISLFWFAWTIYPSVHWICPIIGSSLFGLGCNFTFSAVISYIVEAYPKFAASAVGANVFVRCTMSAAFPLFGRQMFYGMGFHWATTLLALVAVLFMPSSFLLYRYGKTIRKRSKFAQN